MASGSAISIPPLSNKAISGWRTSYASPLDSTTRNGSKGRFCKRFWSSLRLMPLSVTTDNGAFQWFGYAAGRKIDRLGTAARLCRFSAATSLIVRMASCAASRLAAAYRSMPVTRCSDRSSASIIRAASRRMCKIEPRQIARLISRRTVHPAGDHQLLISGNRQPAGGCHKPYRVGRLAV